MADTDNQSLGPEPDTGLAAELWVAGDTWNKAWHKRREDASDRLLYHYTDPAGVYGIVQSKELWASNAAFLNDSTEVLYIQEVLKKVAAEVARRYEEPIVGQYLGLLEEAFRAALLERFEVYVACFCENPDLLSQWRAYPSMGGGYAIGFRAWVLSRGRFLEKIIYDEEAQLETLRSLVMPSCDLLAKGAHGETAEYLTKCVGVAVSMTASNLAPCALSFKHPAFAEEAEWRIIRLSVRDGTPGTVVTPQFRPRAGGLLPFTPLSLERDGDTDPPIAELVVGPSAHPDLAVNAIRQLLKAAGYENAAEMVRRSAAPLRV
jgi:hypothetical protein